MTLKEYIKSLGNQGATDEFAARCKTTAAHLRQVANGYRRAGEYLCINIERESGGEVRCESLRPDVDWGYLRGTGSAKDKAA